MSVDNSQKKFGLSRRDVLRAGALISAAAAAGAVWPAESAKAGAGVFTGQSLRVLTWTDESGRAAVKNILDPFQAQTGAKIVADLTGATSEMVAKIKASASKPQYDLVFLSGVGATALAEQGLLEKPDTTKIPNLGKVTPELRTSANGFAIGYLLATMGLMYSTARVNAPPNSWQALWDDKFSHRIFVPPPDWTDAMALTIAAVKLAGGTIDQPAGGFKLLEKLKDRVLTLGDNPAQIAELFRSGSLDVGGPTCPLYYPGTLGKPEYGLNIAFDIKGGFYVDPQFMVVPKGHPGNVEAIYALMNFALAAPVQANMAEAVAYGTLNQEVMLSPATLKRPGMVSAALIKQKGTVMNQPDLARVRSDWIERYTEIFGMS